MLTPAQAPPLRKHCYLVKPSFSVPSVVLALPSCAGVQGYRDGTDGQGEQWQAMQNHLGNTISLSQSTDNVEVAAKGPTAWGEMIMFCTW